MAKVLGFQIEINGLTKSITTSEELRRAIAEVGKELKKATDTTAINKLEKELIDLKARQAEVNKETREAVKLRQQELTATDKVSGSYDRLSKELNEARKRYKDLAAAEQDSSEEAQELLKRITALDGKLKDIDGSVGQFQRNVGNYPKLISAIVPGIDNIVDSVDSVRSATTGVGVGLGALNVAFTAFNVVSGYVNDLNRSLAETKKVSAQIQTFTKQTGKDLQDTVSQARAVAETYQEDVTDIVNAANAASKELGVSFNDAISSVELGLRKGANAQGEFLDSLREYSSQLGQAGFNIREFTALAIDAAEKGVYSDKAIDAVKEFGTQTREQTKSVRDAFLAAFGEKFTNQLFSNLSKGAITGRDALALVTKQIKDTGVAGTELQGLISTVFVGAGEDAGRYVLGLDDVLNRTDEILASTTSYQEGLKSVYLQNLELNTAQQEYNKLLEETGTTFQTAEIKAKTFFARVAAASISFFSTFGAGVSRLFGDDTATEKQIQFKAARLIEQQEKNAKKQLESLKQFGAVQEVFQFGAEDEKKLNESENKKEKIIINSRKSLQEKLSRLREEQDGVVFGSKEFLALQKEINSIEKTLDKFSGKTKDKGKEAGENFVVGSISEIEKRKGELDKAFERAVAGSDAQAAIARNLEKVNLELEKAIEAQNKILEQASRQAFRAQISAIGEELQFVSQQLNQSGFADKIISGIAPDELVSQTSSIFKSVTDEIEKSFGNNITIVDNFGTVIKDKFTENVNAVAEDIVNFVDKFDIEGNLANVLDAISIFQNIRAEKEQAAIDAQIEQIDSNIERLEEKQKNVGAIRAKQIQLEIDAQKRQREQAEKAAEEAQKKAAKREKTLAIIQATIQGALAVVRAIAAPPGFPLNLGSVITTGVLAAAQVAAIAAQPLATGGVITGRRVTDSQNIPTRSNGDNVLATVKRGEVVLNDRQQRALGGAPVFRSIGVPGFAGGGAINPPISAPTLPATAGNQNAILEALDRKTDAINQRIDNLKVFVVSEDVARDLAEGENLRVQATL